MKRIKYQVRSWNYIDRVVHVSDWADNLKEAKKIARSRAHYVNCLASDPNVHCACNKCLENKGINHIEIWKHKVDQQDGTVKYWEGDDVCCYSKESTGWTWTNWS